MHIIIKFTWRNIKENKFRTFLIILSVMLSTALFFGSTSLSGTISQNYLELLKKDIGTAELVIRPGKDSPSSLLAERMLDPYLSEIEYGVGVMQAGGFYEPLHGEAIRLQILGYDLYQLEQMHKIVLTDRTGLTPFNGRKLLISQAMADKYSLVSGQDIELEVNGEKMRFKLAGIATSTGLFRDDGTTVKAVVPKTLLNGLQNVRGKASVLYIKSKEPAANQKLISSLQQAYPRFVVEEAIPDADIKEYSSRITQPFLMMVTTVLMISVFIIYTSFKVIALERIPVIGTFRSIGAAKRLVNLIFLGESLLYGLIGGAAGLILGIGVLHIMARLTSPNWVKGLQTQVVFSFGQLMMAFAMALTLTLASSFFPIWRVSRIPVKDVVLNNIQPKAGQKRWKIIAGFILVALSILLPPLVSKELVIPVGTLCLILSMIGIIFLIPLLVRFLIWALEGVYSRFFGSEGILALKNLRDNKSIVNNIALLAIGISSLFMIKVTGTTVLTEITSFFRNWDFQLMAAPPAADRAMTGSIQNVPGVEKVYGVFSANNVEILNTNQKIGMLEGINRDFFEFMKLDVPDGPEKTIEILDSGRNIIISNMLRDRLNLKAGQILQLKTERGPVAYKVAGFMNTIENNGQYAIIADRYFKADMQRTTYSTLYIKTEADFDEVQKKIRQKFNRSPFWNESVREIEERNTQINSQMFSIMDAFSYLTILIGIFGVFNNFIISFLERRRSLAVLRSVGLSKRQMIKMLFIEALSGGLIGGVTGLAGGIMAVSGVPEVLKSMGLSGEMIYSVPIFWVPVLVGIGISVIANVGPSLRSFKMNIIDALKYD